MQLNTLQSYTFGHRLQIVEYDTKLIGLLCLNKHNQNDNNIVEINILRDCILRWKLTATLPIIIENGVREGRRTNY